MKPTFRAISSVDPVNAEARGAGLYRQASFLLGAASIKQFPADEGYEVAFAGRSNVGKSSALNVLTGQRGLARVSKTPGRTQQINFFALDGQRRLVDLPGYGYAKVGEAQRREWARLVDTYLNTRKCLRGVVLLMDIRHPLTDFDAQMLDWCRHSPKPTLVVLTKADKLSRSQALQTVSAVERALRQAADGRNTPDAGTEPVLMFSSLKKTGVEALRSQLDQWLEVPTSNISRPEPADREKKESPG